MVNYAMQAVKATPRVYRPGGERTRDRKLGPCIKWRADLAYLGEVIHQTKSLDCLKRKWPEAWEAGQIMLERLTWHDQNFDGDRLPPIIMVAYSIQFGPKFQEDYESAWKRARLTWVGLTYSILPPEESPWTKLVKCTGMDSMYNPKFFIFWDEDPEDWKFMLEDPGPPDKLLLQELTATVAELSAELLTDEEMQEDPLLSDLYNSTGTGGFSITESRTYPEWEIEYDNPGGDYEEEVLIAVRSKAPKKAGEVRDIGIAAPQSIRRHKRVNYLLAKAVKKMYMCPYGRDHEHLKHVMEWLDKNYFWYMKDYEKCGLTVPHPVIRAVYDGFYERRPELAIMANRFYSGIQCHIKNGDSTDIVYPKRGHFLGYWTEGMTLLQYALHRMCCSRLGMSPRSIRFSAVNDDMVAGFKDEDLVERYSTIDLCLCSDLCLSYKQSKSGIASEGFIYCEEYMTAGELDPKEHLICLAILGAKYAINIVHAKHIVHSAIMSRPIITDKVRAAIGEVIDCWGYEFYESEATAPYLFGGWVPHIKDGLDVSIKLHTGDLNWCAAYWAVIERIKMPSVLSERPHLALGRKLGVELVETPEETPYSVDLSILFGTKTTLKTRYRRSERSWPQVIIEYRRLAEIRQRKFTRIEKPWTVPNPETDWLIRHPNSVILDTLPGLKFASDTVEWVKPSTGMRISGLEGYLSYLSQKGNIIYRGAQPVDSVMCDMIKDGLWKVSLSEKLRVSVESGISMHSLTMHPHALRELWLRTGKVPIYLGSIDRPIREVGAAAVLQQPLALIYVARPYLGGIRSNDEVADIIQRFLDSEISTEDVPNPDDSDEDADTTARMIVAWKQIWHVLADHAVDRINLFERSMAHSTVSSSAKATILASISGESADYTLTGLATEEREASDVDSEGSEDFVDPWAELGV